jgi:hypothetical protein
LADKFILRVFDTRSGAIRYITTYTSLGALATRAVEIRSTAVDGRDVTLRRQSDEGERELTEDELCSFQDTVVALDPTRGAYQLSGLKR